MKKKIFTIAIGSLAFIAATLVVSVGVNAQIINTIAGTGAPSFGGDGAAATLAQLSDPSSVKVDAAGNIYIADRGNHCIRKINTTGTISTIAGTGGTSGFSGDGAAATAALLNTPGSMAIDATGNIYISDYGNNKIRKVDAAGIITTIAGGVGSGSSGDGGPATAALLNRPQGINLDAAGNIYFADELNNSIRKITVTTGIISKVAGAGSSSFSGDGGAATAATLQYPKDVVVDADGNVLIADHSNHRIRKVNTAGIISTIAGGTTFGYSGDGFDATGALIKYPYALTIDNKGNLLFNDQGNNRVRKIFTSGIITSVAGNGSYGFSGDGASCYGADLSTVGITSDATGNIYLAEYGYHRIRKITPAAASISGASTICKGNTTSLSSSVSGGSWNSYNASIANVDASGNVTGHNTGISTIGYFTTTDGIAYINVTVNAEPAAIAGTPTVCIAATTSLTHTASGGTWSSSNASIATVDATGNCSGLAVGSALITYTLPTGCYSMFGMGVIACPTEVKTARDNNCTINVYPNPSAGTFSISLPDREGNSVVTVSDILGKTILTRDAGNNKTIDCTIPNAIPGNYFVKVTTGKNIYRSSLVISQ
jgi:trimeric autotransporter adhesin